MSSWRQSVAGEAVEHAERALSVLTIINCARSECRRRELLEDPHFILFLPISVKDEADVDTANDLAARALSPGEDKRPVSSPGWVSSIFSSFLFPRR